MHSCFAKEEAAETNSVRGESAERKTGPRRVVSLLEGSDTGAQRAGV